MYFFHFVLTLLLFRNIVNQRFRCFPFLQFRIYTITTNFKRRADAHHNWCSRCCQQMRTITNAFSLSYGLCEEASRAHNCPSLFSTRKREWAFCLKVPDASHYSAAVTYDSWCFLTATGTIVVRFGWRHFSRLSIDCWRVRKTTVVPSVGERELGASLKRPLDGERRRSGRISVSNKYESDSPKTCTRQCTTKTTRSPRTMAVLISCRGQAEPRPHKVSQKTLLHLRFLFVQPPIRYDVMSEFLWRKRFLGVAY